MKQRVHTRSQLHKSAKVCHAGHTSGYHIADCELLRRIIPGILIRELPSHSDRDVTILICASDSDTARLIGRRGVVANALREAMGIAPKAANESTRIHLKFESFDEEDKDAE